MIGLMERLDKVIVQITTASASLAKPIIFVYGYSLGSVTITQRETQLQLDLTKQTPITEVTGKRDQPGRHKGD